MRYFLLPFILLTCFCSQKAHLDVEQVRVSKEFAETKFPAYCNMNEGDDEFNSVLTSFVGDYQSSYIYASRRRYPPGFSKDEVDFSSIFTGFESLNAIDEIVILSKDYHFTMINEAHYCGQHRVFTTSLLKPLWEKGYRYLALETLGYSDTLMNERLYPIYKTGYYSDESAFGNMIRKAREIGYKLVPYETQFSGQSSTHRDSVQAANLVNQTIRKDTVGKVLVHVGYGHLFEEAGSSYKPMGSWVRRNTERDILTISQTTMTDANLNSKIHPYYEYATESFAITKPVVFKNKEGGFLVDPVQKSGIDLQVYHPKVEFINGRPNWLITNYTNSYPLPEDLHPFEGFLFFSVKKGEPINAIPVDQFVVSKEKSIILPTGEFNGYIADCTNRVIAQFELNAK